MRRTVFLAAAIVGSLLLVPFGDRIDAAPREKPSRPSVLVMEAGKVERGMKAGGKARGILHYFPVGPEFTYNLEAHGLLPGESYTLLYLRAPYGRSSELKCIGSAQANRGGSLALHGSKDLNSNLAEAMLALVSSEDVDCLASKFNSWKPGEYLFGRSPITYTDTNVVSDFSGKYCVTEEGGGRKSSFEMDVVQSGAEITVSAQGITAKGTLSGGTVTISNVSPPFTMVFTFASNGTEFSGTLTMDGTTSALTGKKGACWDYEFPAGNPACILPVNPDLVTGGQQFNSVSSSGVTHTGVDFKFARGLWPISAPCDGVVVEINRHAISEGNIIFDVVIRYNDQWSTFIAFEPYTSSPGIANLQASNIKVDINQVVKKGDLLGYLFAPDTAYPHVHWGIHDAQNTPVCPRDYMTAEAGAALDELYAKYNLLPVCYPVPTPHYP